MAVLQLNGVGLVKNRTDILQDVTFGAAEGEFVALIGSSGSGKTSVLRVVAGLERTVTGEILVDGVDVAHQGPAQRNVAMVFQTSVMYPFADVAGNVAFPLEIQGRPKDEIARRIGAEGRALHIESLFDLHPSELSAGHQQLVQVARAMVRAPSIFLMDEPLASLDSKLRMRMRSELRTVQAGYGVTTLYATNDPTEAMALADRIVVLEAGAIAQVGEPMDVYRNPASMEIAELMGDIGFLALRVEPAGDGFWLVGDGHRIRSWLPALGPFAGRDVIVGIHPEEATLDPAGSAGTVVQVIGHGSHDVVTVLISGGQIGVRIPSGSVPAGSSVDVDVIGAVVFDPADGGALGRIGV